MRQKTSGKPRVSKPVYFLSKKVGEAIADYHMLEDQDRIIVAVSGGKDSMALLRMLKYRQSFVPISFNLLAVHVDLGFPSSPAKTLKEYFTKEEVPFRIVKEDILKGKEPSSLNCFWCSWNRRKILFQLAGKLGFNKIALGHHLDDIVETTLLNMFYQGNISTMNPRQEFFGGKLTIIRPLAYVQEKEIARLKSYLGDFAHDDYVCPNNESSKRTAMKDIIRHIERENPNIKRNIFESIRRINVDYLARVPRFEEQDNSPSV